MSHGLQNVKQFASTKLVLISTMSSLKTKIDCKCLLLCCDRKARAACAQSFTLWQQATIEFTRRNHSIIACSRHVYMGVVLCAHSVRGESRIQRNTTGEVATVSRKGEMQDNIKCSSSFDTTVAIATGPGTEFAKKLWGDNPYCLRFDDVTISTQL